MTRRPTSIGIDTKDLAVMGATLANGGVNPLTDRRMLPSAHVPELLAIMATAGFYDESGAWMYSAGLPSKTGVGGGIVDRMIPGYKDKLCAATPLGVKQYKVKCVNDAFESGIASHGFWQRLSLGTMISRAASLRTCSGKYPPRVHDFV